MVDGVGGGSALITRMHHCMGDGTANVLIARTLFGTAPDVPLESERERRIGSGRAWRGRRNCSHR